MFGALWEWRSWGCGVHALTRSGIMRGGQQTEHQKSGPVDICCDQWAGLRLTVGAEEVPLLIPQS